VAALDISIAVIWGVFWCYWFVSAFGAKKGSWNLRSRPVGLVFIAAGALLLRELKLSGSGLAIHSPVLQAVGMIVFLLGLAFAVWARIHLGRNWGMPMTQKDQPELVTSGPYRFVRHPIYSGVLLGLLGTALATSLYFLIALGIVGAYFLYSASVEERLLAKTFPTAYRTYRAHTKMLIPFVL
jgi:protein-S-isoprenylcysteine O-methyltransferase Ste14